LDDLALIWPVVDFSVAGAWRCGGEVEVEAGCGFLALGALLLMAVLIWTSWPQLAAALVRGADSRSVEIHLARSWCVGEVLV
jgi:hypothetical protein